MSEKRVVMSESQFEKMLRTLKDAERQRDFSRHTIEVQDEIINDLRKENERLRELVEAGKEDRKAIDELVDENRRLRELLEKAVVYSHSMPTTLVAAIEKEVGDD